MTEVSLNEVGYVIVQAGGRGTRLASHTRNKPKCLVSVDGQPLLYALFDRFPNATFVIIVDHLADVLERYLTLFPPPVRVRTVRAAGRGTVAGLRAAMAQLPSDDEPFLLVWSDLRLGVLPDAGIGRALRLGLTATFPCRWSWSADQGLTETTSARSGVMGLFGVPGRRCLPGCPEDGEFVQWLAEAGVPLDPVQVEDAVEIGTIEALAAQRRGKVTTRFFNVVEVHADRVEKRARDRRFASLIADEVRWYEAVAGLGFRNVPALMSDTPLTLARVPGRHPFDLDPRERERALAGIVAALRRLHGCGTRLAVPAAVAHMYREKPLARLETVRRLVPELAARDSLRVNGVLCRNVLHPAHDAWFRDCVDALGMGDFTPIHGDPTFSNTLIDANGTPWFIDPRGRFGEVPLYGDPRYDWAKLYYSVAGRYDRFNARQFQLRIDGGAVDVAIDGHGWDGMRSALEVEFGAHLGAIRIIHGLIWLSLSGVVSDDYDSIVGAYALGLHHLNLATA